MVENYSQRLETGIIEVRLAASIQNQLVMAMQPLDKGYLDRGVKERKNLCVLRETMMPAALVELGFIDSADVRLLKEQRRIWQRPWPEGLRIIGGCFERTG